MHLLYSVDTLYPVFSQSAVCVFNWLSNNVFLTDYWHLIFTLFSCPLCLITLQHFKEKLEGIRYWGVQWCSGRTSIL